MTTHGIGPNSSARTGYTPATRASAAPTGVQGTGPAPEAGAGETETAAEISATSMPEELIRPLAEQLRVDYDMEFDASHLSWQDFASQARRLLAAIMPIHEDYVRVKAAAELMARAKDYADTLTGPRASFRRGLEAAARHILPKLTPEQLAEALRTGEAFAVVCDIPEDPEGGA